MSRAQMRQYPLSLLYKGDDGKILLMLCDRASAKRLLASVRVEINERMYMSIPCSGFGATHRSTLCWHVWH